MPHKGKCNFTSKIVLQYVEDGLRNNVKRLKNWHKTMFNHTNVHAKGCHE